MAGAAAVVIGLGACSMPHESDAREIAVYNVVRLHDDALPCFRGHIRTYFEEADFAEHVGRMKSRQCGRTDILNLDDDEIAKLHPDRDGDPAPFQPGYMDTWYTSAIRDGDTGVVEVTTVGRGIAGSGLLETTQSVAVCWRLVVDIPTDTAEPVYDTDTCHSAVMFGGDIMKWEDVLAEYAAITEED